MPGTSLLIVEMAPALFACVAANEAGRAARGAVVNDVQMMGASGRIFMSGMRRDMDRAHAAILKVLEEARMTGSWRARATTVALTGGAPAPHSRACSWQNAGQGGG